MVGPSVDDEDRERFLVRMRIGFALFVGISMGLVVLRGDGDLFMIGGAVVGGSLAGGVLAMWLFPDSLGTGPRNR